MSAALAANDVVKAALAKVPAVEAQRAHNTAEAQRMLAAGDIASAQRLLRSMQGPVDAPSALPFDFRMFDPLPRAEWIVPGLSLGPGAPCGLFGFSYSAKSLMAQEIGLCYALDGEARIFGEFSVPRGGRVLHVDHEQGRQETANRYQRIARGKGIPAARLERLMTENMLGVAAFPGVYLTTPGAEEIYKRTFDGVPFGIVDSLAAAQHGIEENSAQFAEGLYLLARVSGATGTTFLVIGHTGKVDLGDDKPKDGRALPRGSSAIIGALSTGFAVAGAKGEPKKVSQIKGRALGAPEVEDFYVDVESVQIDGWKNPDNAADGGGIRLVYRTAEAIEAKRAEDGERAAIVRQSSELRKIVDTIAKAGPAGIKGADAVASMAGIKAVTGRALVKVALSQDLIHNVATLRNGEEDDRRPCFVARPGSSRGGQ